MKPHTYSFKYRKASGVLLDATIEAHGSTQAYEAACMDSSFEDCKILKGSFKRTDTAKGANRAGGLDSNGKQLNARSFKEGDKIHVNHQDKQWGRLAYDATIERVDPRGCLVNIPYIMADVWVPNKAITT